MNILKKISFIFLFLLIFISFLPKENLYFLFEDFLSKQKIIFTKERLIDRAVVFNIHKPTIYYEDILVGTIQDISIKPFILYNKIELKDAFFSKEIKNFLPQKTEYLNLTYTPFYPLVAFLSSKGDFGELNGEIFLKDRKFRLTLKPSSNVASKYPMIISKFKKDKDEYIYESTF